MCAVKTNSSLDRDKQRVDTGRFFGVIVTQIILWCCSLIILFPVCFMILTSFKTRSQFLSSPLGLPIPPSLSSYFLAFSKGPLFHWFINSIIIAIITVVLSLFISCIASFAIAKMNFWGKNTLLKITISLMIFPPVVFLVPLFILMTKLNLINTYWSVIIIYLGLQLPFSTFLMTSFFRTVPDEIIEAATIDGCSTFQILRQIMLPLSINVLLTLMVVNTVWIWNELIIALIFLQNDTVRTIVSGLTLFKGRYFVNEPMILAATTFSTLPMILLYLFAHRYLAQGLTTGSIK